MQSAQQARQAPPVGRALRILLGLALIVYVSPLYFQVPARVSVGSLLLIVGLIGIYSVLHMAVSQRIVPSGSGLAAIVANGLLVVLYFIGATGLPIVGGGKGALAAVTFLGISLVVAGVRAATGCAVMAIRGLLFGKTTYLGSIISSPIDSLSGTL